MSEKRGRIFRLASEKPIGDITPRSDRYGTDEAGRAFVYETVESAERKKKYAQFKRDKRHFTFSHMEHIREITESLSNKYCGYILMLQPYIQYETNILVTPGRTPEPMNINGMAEVFGVQRRTAVATIDKLKEIGVIEELDGEQFRVNDRYHFRKKAEVDVDMLVKTFRTSVKKLDLKPAELGIVYKLLPYVHYESNLICDNPFEDNPKAVKFLSKTEIADKVGISRQKVEETLRKLTAAGVIATIQRKSGLVPQDSKEDGRETVVLMNAFIITRRKGEPSVLEQQTFAGWDE